MLNAFRQAVVQDVQDAGLRHAEFRQRCSGGDTDNTG